MPPFSSIKKALTGFTIPMMAAVTSIIASGPTRITAEEWLLLAAAFLTGAGVYGVKNS